MPPLVCGQFYADIFHPEAPAGAHGTDSGCACNRIDEYESMASAIAKHYLTVNPRKIAIFTFY
jgi:hypothetical protein